MYGLLLSELDAYDSRTEILDSYEYNKEMKLGKIPVAE